MTAIRSVQSDPMGRASDPSHGLPAKLMVALRELFDIFDDQQTNYIKIADIECRWKEDENSFCPKGFMESLRKVSTSGYIDFERFCAAIKICLLRNQSDSVLPPKRQSVDSMQPTTVLGPCAAKIHNSRLDGNNLRTARTKTTSMPQLVPGGQNYVDSQWPSDNPSDRASKSKIMNVLRSWRDNVLERDSMRSTSSSRPDATSYEGSTTDNGVGGYHTDPGLPPQYAPRSGSVRRIQRRRETRRHTVSHGIDHNCIKRLQLLEDEKEHLLKGLQVVDRARDWYLFHINEAQERIRAYGHNPTAPGDSVLANMNERLHWKVNRIANVNQHLSALISDSYPRHMNHAFRPVPHDYHREYMRRYTSAPANYPSHVRYPSQDGHTHRRTMPQSYYA
ncbi:Suppressor APC domain-containing protein 2 [Halotydeus destructor]|nr:Suppressor APC domain-containing protein 2 [Halotydeus destructor]